MEAITAASPYPIERAVASQRWSDVLFLHWRVEPEAVAPLLPEGTVPDVWHGDTSVGLIAFRLSEATLGPIGPLRGVSDFVEVNVRLYAVDARGRRGVVFLSLEAARLAAVLAARAAFGLPYFWARTGGGTRGHRVEYASRRIGSRRDFAVAAEWDDTVVADDDESRFLTARWAMFTRRAGRLRWHPNTHEPWVLHPASLQFLSDDLLAAAGFPGIAERAPDSVLFSPGVSARFGR